MVLYQWDMQEVLITLDKERALKIAKRVIDEKLSVRDVENCKRF